MLALQLWERYDNMGESKALDFFAMRTVPEDQWESDAGKPIRSCLS